jgi:hypothetical protein
MKDKIVYIDFNNSTVVDAQLGRIGDYPKISYKSRPTLKLIFLSMEGSPNMSDAQSWHAAIDTDFTTTTEPMCRTFDDGIDRSEATSRHLICISRQQH